jgi:hypothetical protein
VLLNAVGERKVSVVLIVRDEPPHPAIRRTAAAIPAPARLRVRSEACARWDGHPCRIAAVSRARLVVTRRKNPPLLDQCSEAAAGVRTARPE